MVISLRSIALAAVACLALVAPAQAAPRLTLERLIAVGNHYSHELDDRSPSQDWMTFPDFCWVTGRSTGSCRMYTNLVTKLKVCYWRIDVSWGVYGWWITGQTTPRCKDS